MTEERLELLIGAVGLTNYHSQVFLTPRKEGLIGQKFPYSSHIQRQEKIDVEHVETLFLPRYHLQRSTTASLEVEECGQTSSTSGYLWKSLVHET